MKFATKSIRHYPPHLRHVATIPWEIKKSNFLFFETQFRRTLVHDILLAYKILFGMEAYRLTVARFLTLRNQPHLQGHKYVIIKQRYDSRTRKSFL